MINKRVVIAALARDCGNQIIKNIPLVERLRNEFIWSKVVIVENDSIDNTKEVLSHWAENYDGVFILSNDSGNLTIPKKSNFLPDHSKSLYRISKMVEYRNIYLNYINQLNDHIDYIIIIDLDIMFFSVKGIIKSINEAKNDWGGLFSNGVTIKKIFGKTISTIYYDIYAIYEYPLRDGYGYTEKELKKIRKRIKKNILKENYYSIISAFGGIGIYKYDLIKDQNYQLEINCKNNVEAVCEHVPFNTQIIKKGYKNYISKNMYVLYGYHNYGAILENFLPKKIFSFLHKIYNIFKSRLNLLHA